ncbi:hypothetical protein BGZ52_001634 [Haplosporangium bisporale]|nr:hypothetical protein BGZ52_001634 [Haplosporangium bisporale]
MVVHPRLVGVLLRGRSSWRSVSETNYFVLQHHPRQLNNPFRIITRGFPHYRVAEGESVEMLQDELEHLSQMAPVSIKGKITSKKISTWLKASDLAFSPTKDVIHEALQPEEVTILHLVQDEDGYLSDLSTISNEEEIQDRMIDEYDRTVHTQNNTSGSHWPETSPEEISASSDELLIVRESLLEDSKSTRSMYTFQSSPESPGVFDRSSEDTQCQTLSGALGWLKGSPLLDAVVSWIEGPGLHIPQKKSEKDKPNPLLDIPLQFIALLTYPEPDPKTGNTVSLAMVRETSFVRQRRRTLMILTAYTLVVRYCSFDFFLVVLFASNCAMLFLMKNSGRMNVNMAKRAVNQRVGWAKQWAGGFFRRGQGTQVTSSNNKNGSTSPLEGAPNVSYNKLAPSFMASNHSIRTAQTSAMDDATLAENSPRVKRRGFFGKRSTNPPNSTSAMSIHGGEGVVDEPTTQKRRFFKRSTNNGSATATTSSVPSRSSTAPPVSAPGNLQFSTKSIGALPYALSSSSVTVPLAPTARSPATQSSPQLHGILTRSPSPNLSRKSNLTASPKSLAPESIPSPIHRATSPPASAPTLSLPTATPIPPSSSSTAAQGRSLSKTILASLTSSRSSSSQQQDSGRNNNSGHTVVSPTASRPAVALVAATRDHGLPVEVLSSRHAGRMFSDEDTESDHRQHYQQGAYNSKFSSSPEDVYHPERKRSVQHEKAFEHLDMLDPVTSAAADAMEGFDREA